MSFFKIRKKLKALFENFPINQIVAHCLVVQCGAHFCGHIVMWATWRLILSRGVISLVVDGTHMI